MPCGMLRISALYPSESATCFNKLHTRLAKLSNPLYILLNVGKLDDVALLELVEFVPVLEAADDGFELVECVPEPPEAFEPFELEVEFDCPTITVAATARTIN